MSNLQILLRDGEHVVWEKAISRDSITLKGGRAYLPATVLGKFTTGTDAGKHTILTPGATDGSQTPDAVLRSGVDATLSDRPGVAHVRDCRMNPAMLVWPSGASDELKAASLATLKGKGVLMNTPPVQRAAAIAADFAAGNYAADGNALALGDIVSTARAGTAYALDAAGVFQAFTTGQPRRTSRGLLAEPEKTNLLRYSTDMTNAAWSVVTATKTTLAGAVGPFNRVSIAASSAATPGSNIGANTLVDLVAGTAYAVTYWYEIGSSGSVLFRIQQNFGSGLPSNAAGKISENGIGATSGGAGPITEVITRNLGGVYWRTTLIFMPNATGPHTIRIGPAALTVGPDIVGLGAQVEEAFPSSIIPTTTATVTRPADNLVPLGALAKALGAEQATINIDILDMANATGDILASGPTKARRMASIDSSGDMYLRINADRAHVQRGKPVNPRLTRLSLLRNAEGTRLTRDGGVTALDGPSVAINDGVSLMPSIPGYIVSLQTSPDADAILPTTRASGWKTLKGAGGAGGFITNVWRSSNGTMLIRADVHNAYRRRVGETAWTELITAKTMPTVQLLKNGGASEIVSAPSNPLRLYMLKTAVAESGTPTYLYRSDDEGDHWTLVSAYVAVTDMNSNRSDRTGGYYIAVDPANPDVLLVSSPAGVRMSTDAGATWSAIAALGTANTTGFGIAFDPTSSVVSGKTQGIYVMKGGTGVYRSTDGGANFTLTTSGPTTFRNMVCAQDGTLWLAPNDATASVIWRFKAGAWASKNTHAAANRTIVGVAVNPADANHVVALNFSGYISESKDGGETWGGMATYTFRAAPNIPWHLWTNAPLLAASNIVFGQDGYVHVAEGLGMYRTKPGEPNASITVWEEESVGIEELVANDILVLPDGTVLTEGWDRPIFRSRDMDSYARRHGPDNTNTIVHCWSADYYGGDFVVALCNTTSPSAVERSSYSTDGGRTWTKFAAVPAAVTSNAKVGGCIAAATDQKLYWACAEGGPLYYSPDRGATWSVVTGSGINTNVASDSGWGPSKNYKRRILVADKLSPGVVYAYNCGGASTAGFYRIVDGVATRVFTGEIAGASQYNAKCKQKPGASSLFFTSGPGGASTFAGPSFGTGTAPFRRSEDGGVTWTTVPDIEEVWDFSWGKAKAGSQYPTMFALGFYKGVWGHWMSTDDARTFTSIGGTGAAALPDYSMDAEVCIAGDPNIFGRLYAGFQGSGFKYFDLPTGGGGADIVASTPAPTPPSPTLGALTLSGPLQVGVAASGTIIGATTGSTITTSIPGITVNSGARTYSGTPTTEGAYNLTETLVGATNSPRNSSISVAAGAPVAPGAPTLSVTVGGGQNFVTFTDGAPGSGITTRRIYRSTTSGFTPGAGNLIVTNPTLNPYPDENLTDGTTYYYKAIAANAAGDSPASTQVSGTPGISFGLPAELQGASGNFASWPQTVYGSGTRAGKYWYATVINDGSQVVRRYDSATAALEETKVVRTGSQRDDHNVPAVIQFPNGAFTTVAAGHNETGILNISDCDPAGNWTDSTINIGSELTYPNLFLDKNGKTWLLIRNTNFLWRIVSRDSFGGAWNAPITVMQDTNQCYIACARYDPVDHKIRFFARPNSEVATFGALLLVEFDCATGEFFHPGGALGKLSGASANGQVLPFDISELTPLAAKPSGRVLSAQDMTNDGKTFIIRRGYEADPNNNPVEVWRFTGTDRFNLAHWTVSSTPANSVWNMSQVSNYSAGWCIDKSVVSGFTMFVVEGENLAGGVASYTLKKYSTTDYSAWTTTIMAKSLAQICRPMVIEGAPQNAPLSYCRMSGFIDYNNYTFATALWTPKDKVIQPFYLDGFAEASDTALTAHVANSGQSYSIRTGVHATNGLSCGGTVGRTFAAAVNASAIVSGTAPEQSVAAEVVVSRLSSTSNIAEIGLRCDPDPAVVTGYYLQVNNSNGAFAVQRRVAGSGTTLINYTGASVQEGNVARMEVIQSGPSAIINVFRNGLLVGTATDTSPLTGNKVDLGQRGAATVVAGGVGFNAALVTTI